MTPQPKRVLRAAVRGAEKRANAWQITPDDFFGQVETLRKSFASVLGCSPENIAIVPSASYGVATAANNIGLGAGESVMMLEEQFPSNYYSWQRLAKNAGAQVCVVSKQEEQDWTSAILEHLQSNSAATRIATLENHHWSTGEAIDLAPICDELHNRESRIVLDLTQTVGACPVDIARLDPDFAAIAAYKWLFCPYGVSFLYVADRHLNGAPIEENWSTRYGSENFSQLASYTDRYHAGARRFDMGECASFSNIAAAIEALAVLQELGVENISKRIGDINVRVADILAGHGFDVLDAAARGPHIQSARLKTIDIGGIAAALANENVFVSQRGDRLRFSPHVYNDTADLEKLDRSIGLALHNLQ